MPTSKEHYQFSNTEIITLLKEVMAAMEVKNVSFFRIRAYQNVIASIESLTSSVYDLWKQNKLDEIPGLGSSLKQHMDDLFTKGKVKDFDEIRKDLPQGMFELIGLRGIGAKKAFKLAEEFNLDDRKNAKEKLKNAAEKGKIAELDGFAEKSQQQILEAISESKKQKNEKQRMLLAFAEDVSKRIIAYLEELDCVEEVVALGSLRRREATVGDLDIAVATTSPQKVLNHFVEFPEVGDVLAKGDTRAAIVLNNDVQIDIRVTEKDSFGAMIQYFTGNKQHNIIVRTHALDQGFSLSEYGIKSTKGKDAELEKFKTEEEFYKKIGLPLIPPELRQGRNEVELAINDKLPDLVEISDIKGDLHTHSTDSDGVNTLDEMVEKAIKLGYEYIGNADHAPSVQARGRFAVLGIVQQKRERIEQINSSQDVIRVLYGYEINVLADGSISLDDDIIEKLDYAIGGIHTAFNQDRKQLTQRYLNAIKHPKISIIAHPSARLINERPPLDVDWEKIFEAAQEHKKIIEINAQPSRLDLPEDLVRDAIKLGIGLVINTDAHSTGDLEYMKYGIDVARRGFCTKQNIINTKSLEQLKKTL